MGLFLQRQGLIIPSSSGEATDPYWNNVQVLVGYEETVPLDASQNNLGVSYKNGALRNSTPLPPITGTSYVARCTSSDDRVHISSSTPHLGSADFTFETWFYPTGGDSWGLIMGKWISGAKSYSMFKNGSLMKLGLSTNGSTSIWAISLTPPGGGWTFNRWYFCAADYDGVFYRMYCYDSVLDQTIWSSDYASRTLYNSGSGLALGSDVAKANEARGYFDETRLTTGVARYGGGSFAPPTATFPRS